MLVAILHFPIYHRIQLLRPTSLVQITSNLVYEHVMWSHRPFENLGEIDHNLCNYISHDVI